jgi:hypothetical protein
VNGDGILRVTEALRDRLKEALVISGMPGTVFVGPLDDADSSGAALILFLYRIVPNANLRNREHRAPSSAVPPTVFQNALPLDLYFIVTVGTMPGASEEAPLRSLGFAIQAIQADPELTGPAVGQETVHVTLEPLSSEEASRIWALFPNANYRTSIAYLASPVWIDPRVPEQIAEPVVDDRLLAGSKSPEAIS